MAAKLSWSRVAVCAVPLAVACGDDGGSNNNIINIRPDAAPDAMVECKAAPSYTPTFAEEDQYAEDYPATGSGEDATLHNIFFNAALDAEDPGDYLFLDLYEQYGAFSGGDITTGTFAILDEDMDYSTCGLCVMLGADVTDEDVTQWYIARSGVVELTSVIGRLTGTLTNVRFYRVLHGEDGWPSDNLTYDCETVITSASFDIDITPVNTAQRPASAVRRPAPRLRK